MILVVDAGNSRVKWGLHDSQHWQTQGWCENLEANQLAAQWHPLPPPHQIVVANVAGDTMKTELQTQFQRWPIKPHWIAAQKEQCGVKNSYDDPTRLGSDRWAALIAAWNQHRHRCVVVNIGTAVTIDALSDHGVFLGGFILPGLALMRRALATHTADVNTGTARTDSPYPQTTDDAVYNGGLAAITGAIEYMVAQLTQGEALPVCLLSGGGATAIAPRLPFTPHIIDNLVLDGLIRIARTCA